MASSASASFRTPDIHLVARLALEEDHDNLLPVVEECQQRPQWAVLAHVPSWSFPSKPFALARVIAEHKSRPSFTVLTAEAGGKVVGMLAVDGDVDVARMQRDFILDTYDNLVQLSQESHEGDHDDPKPYELHVEESGDRGGSPLPNCFCVTMLCVAPEHESGAIDLVQRAFQEYPSCDYCVLTLPTEAPEPPIVAPFFSRVLPRSTSDYVLYLIHRHSLLPGFEVRLGTPRDAPGIEALMADSPSVERRAVVSAARQGPGRGVCVVAAVASEIVGAALLSGSLPTAALRSNYDIDHALPKVEVPTTDDDMTELQVLVLNPIFASRRRQLMVQALELAGGTCLVCRLPPSQLLPEAVSEMLLVPPRLHANMLSLQESKARRLRGDVETASPLDASATSAPATESKASSTADQTAATSESRYALYVATERSLLQPRVVANAPIVVVGASSAGLACLHTLLQSSRMALLGLTLVATDGLAGFLGRNMGGAWAPVKEPSEEQWLAMSGVDSLVAVVEDTVVGLDREAKTLQLGTGCSLTYHRLVIACGMQDQTRDNLGLPSWPLSAALRSDQLGKAQKLGLLNAHAAAPPIVVYGSTLDAMATVRFLLSNGVPGLEILMVWSEVPSLSSEEPDESPTQRSNRRSSGTRFLGSRKGSRSWTRTAYPRCLADRLVEEKVTAALQAAGVRILQAVLVEAQQDLSGHVDGPVPAPLSLVLDPIAAGVKADISGVQGQAAGGNVHQQCRLLVCCDLPQVDPSLFRAVNDASIVYNGGLVVDHRWKTNDPAIYGAGPLTKLSRRYGIDRHMERHCSAEVGQAVARSILEDLGQELGVAEGWENGAGKHGDGTGGLGPLKDSISRNPGETRGRSLGQPARGLVKEGRASPDEAVRVEQEKRGEKLVDLMCSKAFAAQVPGGLWLAVAVTSEWLAADEAARIARTRDMGAQFTDGRTVVTDTARGLCRMDVDRLGRVVCLVFCTTQRVEPWKVQRLVGLPASILGNVLDRYDEGRIDDLLDWLQQPWAAALYHDRFSELLAILRRTTVLRPRANELWAISPASGPAKKAVPAAEPLDSQGAVGARDHDVHDLDGPMGKMCLSQGSSGAHPTSSYATAEDEGATETSRSNGGTVSGPHGNAGGGPPSGLPVAAPRESAEFEDKTTHGDQGRTPPTEEIASTASLDQRRSDTSVVIASVLEEMQQDLQQVFRAKEQRTADAEVTRYLDGFNPAQRSLMEFLALYTRDLVHYCVPLGCR